MAEGILNVRLRTREELKRGESRPRVSSTYGFERRRRNSEEQAAHAYGDDLEAEIVCQAAKKHALQKVISTRGRGGGVEEEFCTA